MQTPQGDQPRRFRQADVLFLMNARLRIFTYGALMFILLAAVFVFAGWKIGVTATIGAMFAASVERWGERMAALTSGSLHNRLFTDQDWINIRLALDYQRAFIRRGMAPIPDYTPEERIKAQVTYDKLRAKVTAVLGE